MQAQLEFPYDSLERQTLPSSLSLVSQDVNWGLVKRLRQWILIPPFTGSNPVSPAKQKRDSEKV